MALFSHYSVHRKLERMDKSGDESKSGKEGRKRLNREQLHAAQEAWMHMASILQGIHEELEAVEKDLWDELEEANPIKDFSPLETLIQDLGASRVRHSLNEQTVSLYWIMKGVLAHVLMERDEKQKGNEIHVQF